MTRKGNLSALLFTAALFCGCGAEVDEPTVGGETHFLSDCEESCGDGLSCIAGVCTRECDNVDDCDGLPGDPQCTGSAGLGDEVCDAACDNTADCETIGPDHECAEGFCRGSAEEPSEPAPSDSASSEPASTEPAPSLPQMTCEEGGNTYALGDSWPCSDGCNTCACSEDGIESTLLDCPTEPEPSLPQMTCEDGGNTYALGDSWPCSDGCNTCACSEEGVSSTDLACQSEPEPSLPQMTCEDGGNTYVLGETWTCSDGCNQCECGEAGISSTDAACLPCTLDGEMYAVGATVPSDCNTCTCQADGTFACTMIACDPGTGCDVDGVYYAPGDEVPSGDSCNTCTCLEGGSVECTAAACPEVLEFSDWTVCEDEACLCEALAACSNVAYQEALPLGSYNARICSRTADTCRVAYFSETEGGGTGYDCNVPRDVDLCVDGFDRAELQSYCEPLYDCNLLGLGPDCPEPAMCEASAP